MTLYKNISEQDLVVDGFLVEAGATIDHASIENPYFEVVEAKKAVEKPVSPSSETKGDTTIKEETKEIK